MVDLEDAKDKVMMGAERKSMVMKDEERKLTAYHEVGPRHLSPRRCRATIRCTKSRSSRAAAPSVSYWRPAEEPTCCGSGCIDCPF
jgi:hypothetical protein